MLITIYISFLKNSPFSLLIYFNYNSNVVFLKYVKNFCIIKKVSLIILSYDENFIQSEYSYAMRFIIHPITIEVLSMNPKKEWRTIEFIILELIAWKKSMTISEIDQSSTLPGSILRMQFSLVDSITIVIDM